MMNRGGVFTLGILTGLAIGAGTVFIALVLAINFNL